MSYHTNVLCNTCGFPLMHCTCKVKLSDILPCKACGSAIVDTDFRDAIGCIAYVECYDCKSIGPFSKNHGMDRKEAEIEAIKLWNEDR